MNTNPTNKLLWGDCLKVMKKHLKDECVDLIYLDPPFKSNKDYNAIYKLRGFPIPEQTQAFSDTWKMATPTRKFLLNLPKIMGEKGYDKDNRELIKLFLDALRTTNPKMCSYLTYMTQRLIEMRRVLKPTGSIYLHCDHHASHYLKIVMDAIFGKKNFRNEIVWCYGQSSRGAKAISKSYARNSDCMLFYGKSQKIFFKKSIFTREYTVKEAKKQGFKEDSGRWFKTAPRGDYTDKSISELEKQGRIHRSSKGTIRIKYFLETRGSKILETVKVGNVWQDIPDMMHTPKTERMGYPTQKPLKLLERIIKASSNEGDLVLDPFCGCATTIEAAQNLKRKWIGIDIGLHAIKAVGEKRLKDRCHLIKKKHYILGGWPITWEQAEELANENTFLFQKWAVESVDGFCTEKQTGDGGIDGALYFRFPPTKEIPKPEWQKIIIEVKSGKNVNVDTLRTLQGVLQQNKKTTPLAGLIVLHPLGKSKMRNWQVEIDAIGTYTDMNRNEYPRIQILTVQEILNGKKFTLPTLHAVETSSGQNILEY